MDRIIYELVKIGEKSNKMSLFEVIIIVFSSFILSLLISFTYKKTHKGRDYSPSFMLTLIIVCVVIAIIIEVIGNNIARAFGLAGALSIIRFRSAIRDPKDVAFIFFSMGTGLACGAKFFIPTALFVVILCLLIYILHIFNFGSVKTVEKLLKITIPENINFEGLFDDILQKHLESYSLRSVKTTGFGTMFELVYSVRVKNDSSDKVLIDEIRTRNGNMNIALMLDQQNLE